MGYYFVSGLITAIIVYGIWFTFQEGEIFGVMSKVGNKYVPKKLRQPLYECPVCMVPYYGSLFLYAGAHVPFWSGLLILAIAVGINAIIVGLKQKEIVKYVDKPVELSPQIIEGMKEHACSFLDWYMTKYYHRVSDFDIENIEHAKLLYKTYITELQNKK